MLETAGNNLASVRLGIEEVGKTHNILDNFKEMSYQGVSFN